MKRNRVVNSFFLPIGPTDPKVRSGSNDPPMGKPTSIEKPRSFCSELTSLSRVAHEPFECFLGLFEDTDGVKPEVAEPEVVKPNAKKPKQAKLDFAKESSTGTSEPEMPSMDSDEPPLLEADWSCMTIEPSSSTKLASFLYQDQAKNQFSKAVQSGSFCILLVAPSGHGKDHLMKTILHDYFTDADVEDNCDDDTTSRQAFQKYLEMSTRFGLKSRPVVVQNIEGLDTDKKKVLSQFVKSLASKKCKLVLTSDSLQESPTKTLKTLSHVTTIVFKPQDSDALTTIVQNYAFRVFQMEVSEASVRSIVHAAQGNPRQALTTFDFAVKTRHAKKTESKPTERQRDVPWDLFSQVGNLVKGRAPPMSLESSDTLFVSHLAFENSSNNRDSLEVIDILQKKFLLESKSVQDLLELTFKVKPTENLGLMYGLKMPGPSKMKLLREAAWWPTPKEDDDLKKNSLRPFLKPQGLDAHDRLQTIREQVSKEKRWSVKSPFQNENEDVRSLRKTSSFVKA